MIIASVMTRNPLYVRPEMTVTEVRELMTKEKVGKLPVLDKHDNLVGIVTKKDLVNAGPSAATTLDMYEISYLLSKLKVEKVMEKNVITVSETEVVEEAARIMADKGVSCLPVMKDNLLVGIITESDLFTVFVDMFGTRHQGVRITFSMDEKPGQLARVAKELAELGGNIVSLVTFDGDDMSKKRCTCKVCSLSIEQVKEVFEKLQVQIEDIR